MLAIFLAMLAVSTAIAPAAAQSAGGPAARQHFAGTWAFTAAVTGGPSLDVSITVVTESGGKRRARSGDLSAMPN
jgi:hypothetical protein